jgi:predicted N-acetyltransferase YhbS
MAYLIFENIREAAVPFEQLVHHYPISLVYDLVLNYVAYSDYVVVGSVVVGSVVVGSVVVGSVVVGSVVVDYNNHHYFFFEKCETIVFFLVMLVFC